MADGLIYSNDKGATWKNAIPGSPIQVFEHESLQMKGDSDRHRQQLERFLGSNDEQKFPYYSLIHGGVKFRQYVGILSVGDLTIEVLPKVDKGSPDHTIWRENLIHMLSKVYKLDVAVPSSANQKIKTNSTILDVFIKRFLDEVEVLLNRGLVKCYHKEDGNSKAMKGKLLVSKHLQCNYVHKERFYVRYYTYDHEHVMNCLLRQALEVTTMATQNVQLRGRAVTMLFDFPELHSVNVCKELFDNLQFDRKTEDYRNAINLARLFLLNYQPSLDSGNENVLALMFDMNKLWEEYVFIMLCKALQKEGYEVKAQVHKNFWHLKDGGRKVIKPDIVVLSDSKNTFVLDTKWKCPDGVPSDGDLHQLYVYQQMFSAKRVALVYPLANNSVGFQQRESFFDTGAPCDMLFFPIDMDFSLEQLEQYFTAS